MLNQKINNLNIDLISSRKDGQGYLPQQQQLATTTWAISPWKREKGQNGLCVCVVKMEGNWSQLVAFPAVKRSNWLIDASIVTDHVGDKRKSPDGR